MMAPGWLDSRPILCLVTPGGSRAQNYFDALNARIAAAIEAGVDLVQVREPSLEAGALFDAIKRAVERRGRRPTRIVVNDRLDVALAARADGVHLGARSMPADRVRELVRRPFIVGRSVHSAEEARSFQPGGAVDYLIAGTVFPTPSHPAETRLLGPEGLAQIALATDIPVLGIGGIGFSSIASIARTGAAGIAAIRLFEAEGDVLRETVGELRRLFGISRAI